MYKKIYDANLIKNAWESTHSVKRVSEMLGLSTTTVYKYLRDLEIDVQHPDRDRSAKLRKAILEYRATGATMRETAKACGCSSQYVQMVMSGRPENDMARERMADRRAERDKEICEGLQEGYPLNRVAADFRLSPIYVSRIAARHGIVFTPKKVENEARDKEMVRLLEAGTPVAAIADKMGMSASRVYGILRVRLGSKRNRVTLDLGQSQGAAPAPESIPAPEEDEDLPFKNVPVSDYD